ncbi:MAG: sigma-70 family RNA polymerase sigma factor [Actinomycetota bacterium]|nr:sigma-70 family RNA polymerase sigma factor [Actinomycetota bacterium]
MATSAERSDLGDVWRRERPHVLGALTRRFGNPDACEDAAQEALAAATTAWPRNGVPDDPRAWLVRVASRRLIDAWRSDRSRADREVAEATRAPGDAGHQPPPDETTVPADGDLLPLLLMCCQPTLTPASQVALTLRTVAGLTTAQIARAFLVPEATMAQRISRAKATLRASASRLGRVGGDELPDRLAAALAVLYLVFNEGYTASAGPDLEDVRLSSEAMDLTRRLHERLPSHDEITGLLALMLLTEARRPARTDPCGDLVPLDAQDRSVWRRDLIAEGTALVEAVLPRGTVGPYQLQAAIAAVHAEAPTWADTDWPQISALYRMLDALAPSRTVTLNRAVAVAMVDGPEAGLAVLDELPDDDASRRNHRSHAVRAHLLEMAGRRSEAANHYAAAARLATNVREQRYLNARLGDLDRRDERA